ncbi:Separin [Papilio xuthus]|uniref:separase n=1 Tax=Papilio xuthus TaxID=66420 RepID=A0A194PRL9_PAPXU|nr:Separin [Papilio xuthus]
MEDFDVFTDEIEFTETFYKNVLNKYVKNIPSTPSGPNYQSSRKLYAEEYLAENKEADCAFYLSEAVSASVRTLAVYRDEQIKASENKTHKIACYIKPKDEMIIAKPKLKSEKGILDFLSKEAKQTAEVLDKFRITDEVPFYKQYMRFGPHNNTENLLKILKELPKEWTIIQLTAAYNPNENLKPQKEFKTEISSFYMTMLKNDYINVNNVGPLTVNVPAYVHKEGEKPLFTELYSLLEDNYNTIGKAQFINKKRLVQNYWSKREDIDLRMKGVINLMERDWLGGWSSLLTGRLRDTQLRDRLVKFVDNAIADWGFLKLTTKQKTLLYNLIDSCHSLPSNHIKSCIRRILTEHGNTEDIRRVINKLICKSCSKQFKFPNELCLKCLSKCFEEIHHVSLVSGIKAFSQVATQVKESEEWATLNTAKRWPVILIVDELLDTFPWEMLSAVRTQAVCRMENIHFTYYLYKVHEKNFVDGHLVNKAEVGRYIINPEKNLERMEKRMTSFLQYWCAEWRGHVGLAPSPQHYLQYLTEADFFLYCGHGDGCQLAGGGPAWRVRTRTAQRCSPAAAPCVSHPHQHAHLPPPLTTICTSPRGNTNTPHPLTTICTSPRGNTDTPHPLTTICTPPRGTPNTPTRSPPSAHRRVVTPTPPTRTPPSAHRRVVTPTPPTLVRILCSPLVVGMLWEVTDLEVDKAVSALLALCVPPRPPPPAPWHAVPKDNWSQGILEAKVESSGGGGGGGGGGDVEWEREAEVLGAVRGARSHTAFTMIACSIVARGLPVLVHQHNTAYVPSLHSVGHFVVVHVCVTRCQPTL